MEEEVEWKRRRGWDEDGDGHGRWNMDIPL